MKRDQRPINVGIGDLLQFRWPVIALASISHRIAGVVLFVGLAVLLYALEVSLSSEAGFETVKTWMNSAVGKVITWGLLSALAYHFVAGVKHLILDGSDAESLLAATWAARITLAVSAILMGLAAYWVI
ncbi:MAG: succinate dehydrogenase, cytochrome b556 subunit [Gammaproteobacteria bacterium TMED95]|nr:succinate dehydrogenase, cytochrome b556 subunit [Gammaproteobacteria bacterium]OUV20163.1 MAG: succinate dehydrogenase, cytochrome b556 subunit [Gammaproteobacteria bacterium TMED95]